MEPDAFESQSYELTGFENAGDRALVRSVTRALAAGSGLEMDVETWSVWTFGEDGLAVRVEAFLPHQEDEARRAAGLQ
jgi:hypothetical protein